jgi:23S rRNA (pseudouridine1915-N3)-methyltransferase
MRIVMDERGLTLGTLELARRLKAWQQESVSVAFVIGGPDGLDAEFKRKAHLSLRLSDLTLPHALARVILIEQLYRGISVLANHPYHRE